MKRNDHVVIPKSILKRFTDKNSKITCLNLQNYSVNKKTLNSVFTEENYYIDEIDKIIRDKDESIIGNLYKSISDNKDKYLKLKISDIEYMRYIFFLQFFRNNAFSKKLERNVKYIDKKTMHNISIASLIDYLETGKLEDTVIKEIYEEMEQEYKEFTPGFIKLDNLQRSFLLPASQFTYFSILKSGAYIYPIAPDVALIWKKNSSKKFEYGSTNDYKVVEKINKFIIEREISTAVDYMVFGKEDEIDKMLEIIKNNKNFCN